MARPRTISMCSSFLYVFVIISFLGHLSVNTITYAQEATTTASDLTADLDSSIEADSPPVDAGQALCACSPSTYQLTLDFSLTCPPMNVTRNGGIAATFCQISPFGDAQSNITDLVPVSVGYVDVLELGQTFEVLTQVNITGTFVNGDIINYTSIAASDSSSDPEVPKVIQLNMFAFNAAGEPIVNFFAIAFSNNCDEYPTLIEGESAGWVQFVSFITLIYCVFNFLRLFRCIPTCLPAILAYYSKTYRPLSFNVIFFSFVLTFYYHGNFRRNWNHLLQERVQLVS